mgnify:CR=1 FL=1
MTETYQETCMVRSEPFFSGLNQALQLEIDARVVLRSVPARHIVYFPGDDSESVYWVKSGRIKISRVSGDGRELTFRHFFTGGMFGEECMIEGERRANFSEALEPTELISLHADYFRTLLAREVDLALAVAQANCHRVREAEFVLSETVFRSVRGRIAAGLLRLYHQGSKQDRTIRVTHQEMANLVGSTRETTTSVLHGLKNAGLLEMANRKVTVLDPEALSNLAQKS